MTIINSNHPYIILSKELQTLAKPLESIGITQFSYLNNYFNGIQINLSSSPEWIEDYYNYKLFHSSAFEANPKLYKQTYTLWSSYIDDSAVILHGKNYYNSDHGLTFMKQSIEGCEFYFFSGPANHKFNHSILMNNQNALQHFILYFKEKMAKPINKLGTHPLSIKKAQHNQLRYLDVMPPNHTQLADFFKKTAIRRLHLQLPNFNALQFSPQQTKCIRSLLALKKAPEIAVDLGVAQRTVESYLDEIKQKLRCQTKTELQELLIYLKDIL